MVHEGWREVVDGRLYIPVAVTLVLGGAVAAWNASWNDGLLMSWLFVSGPVCGWLWNGFVQSRTLSLGVVLVPVGFGALAGVVVGTLGYAIGRLLLGDDGTGSPGIMDVLVGRDPAEARRWWLTACGLFVIVTGSVVALGPDSPTPIRGVTLLELVLPLGTVRDNAVIGVFVILGWLGVASWPAYRRVGLLASWGIVFGPIFGAVLTAFVLDGISGSGAAMDATLAVVAALVVAVVLGSGGYLLGTVVRLLFGPDSPGRQSGDPST
jgi:hypothetical protein